VGIASNQHICIKCGKPIDVHRDGSEMADSTCPITDHEALKHLNEQKLITDPIFEVDE